MAMHTTLADSPATKAAYGPEEQSRSSAPHGCRRNAVVVIEGAVA
jgi:hypothetical protein